MPEQTNEEFAIDLIEITTAVGEARLLAERHGFGLLMYVLNIAQQEVLELLKDVYEGATDVH